MKGELDHETLLYIMAILIVCMVASFVISMWLLFNNDKYKTVDFSIRTHERMVKDESITEDKYNYGMYGNPYADRIYRDKEANETGI
jgi:hypothetical protein